MAAISQIVSIAVVHEINLAAAVEFLLDGGLDKLLVPVRDHGLNCHAVFGRRFDHAHVAQTHQRHVQRARNRRRRHGEHVHFRAHLLDAFFVAHAEALLLVHHQQAEVGELHVLGQQAVGADQDVHFAGFHSLQNFFHLLGRPEAADHFDRQRKRRESLLESFVVLEREDSSGREHGDLLVVAQGLEGGAHRDFGLAVADVAAQQAIHGELRFHVALHVGDGLRLVLGLVVFERVFELLHPLRVGRKDVPLRGLALRIELEQLVGHILHRLAHARFGLAPRGAAQVIQDGLRALRRTIFLHQIEPSQRNIEPRGFGILEQHEFRGAVALVDFLQALILPDAVLHVDNVIANLQIAEVRKKRRDFRFLPLRTRRHQIRFVEQIARPKNRQMRFRQDEAVGKVSLQQRGGENVAGKIGSFVGIAFSAARAASQTIRSVVLGEHVGEPLDFSRVGDGKNYLRAAADQLLNLLDHRGHRAVEARSRLRKKSGFRSFFAASWASRATARYSKSAPGSAAVFSRQLSGVR